MNKPIKGKFVFNAIQEGEGSDTITFNPPLVIDYTIYEKVNTETGEENYPEDSQITGFATFDFGMDIKVALTPEHNWLVNGYQGMTKESPLEDILMNSIIFDLFHSFFHPPEDPNYSHYNWALLGWLKERAIVKESD